jgi:hypothetical protein
LRREIGGPESTTLISVAVATNNGAADYHALQLQYRKQAARNAQALVSYAWSHSIDNSSSDASLHWAGEGFRALEDRGSSDFDVRHAFTAALTWESPLLRGWLSRWAVDGIVRARSGFPVNVQTTEFVAGLAYANIYRADLASGQPVWIDDRRSPGGRRLNRAAFLPNPPGVQGSLGRNAVRGFGMSQIDMALRREISLTDRAILHLRVEAFNLLNSPNFADPLRFLSSALFGDSPSMLNMMLGTGSPGSGLTPVLQTGGARSLQIVLRLRF